MEFKVGQKYRIVDIDAWWDKEAYLNWGQREDDYVEFNNGDIIEVVKDYEGELCFFGKNDRGSQVIESLVNDGYLHDSCIELIEE